MSLPELARSVRPSADTTPVVTLYEGNTPLLPAPRLSRRVGAEVFLKIEGANPTLAEAAEMVSRTPCAVAHGVVEVWPLQSTP